MLLCESHYDVPSVGAPPPAPGARARQIRDGLRALGTAPNPATDRTQVRFSLDRTAEVTVEVFDVLGRLVQTIDGGAQVAGERAITVDTAGLSTGAYIYRVRLDDGAAVTGRMMVVR